MNQLSDSESYSSDDGIRYKTESTRYKTKDDYSKQRRKHKKYRKSRSRSRSPSSKNRTKYGTSQRTEKKLSELYSSKVPSVSKINNTEDHKIIGPSLPSKLTTVINPENIEQISETSRTSSSGNSESYGPALPPSFKNKIQEDKSNDTKLQPKIIGPALPHTFSKVETAISSGSELPEKKNNYCPQLPPNNNESHSELETNEPDNLDEEEDFDSYGPLPPGISSNSQAHIALEERALQMKIDKLNPAENKIVREEWMTELPEISKRFGLGPRQFKPNAGPDFSDRSSWTDMPKEKSKKSDDTPKKIDVKKEAELKELKKYDEEQEKMIKKHKKHKKEKSLVEIHQDKLNKKKKDEGPSERRPFNRETDLKVNHFDEAQKKAILKKAQLLDDRFSRGQSKFL